MTGSSNIMGPLEFAEILPGCSFKAKTRECGNSRATYKIADYSDPRLNDTIVWTHANCVCNEVKALMMRHQLETNRTYSGDNIILRALNQLVHENNGYEQLKRSSFREVINHYSGAKKKEYERGAQSLSDDPLNFKKDAKVRMFLKDDKYHIDTLETKREDAEIKPARCIQFRNKRYGLTLATYLQPLEHKVYSLVDRTGTFVFAKGRNMDQRASDLAAKWDSFVNPVGILLDHSKFDCHVKEEHLEQEHAFYENWFKGDQKLSMLLRMQKRNSGSTHLGTTYRTVGTRMSGDQNTGLGNSCINYGMLRPFGGENAAYYIDGDDSVIIVERADLNKLDFSFFELMGMSTKHEVVYELEKVEFCQCRPVYDGVNWHMVRNPMRVLARLPWLTNKKHLPVIPRYLKSIGMCELALNLGIPVLQSIAESYMKAGGGKYIVTDRHYLAKDMYIKPWNAKSVPIRQVTRESFERAWAISIEEQEKLEKIVILRPESNVIAQAIDIIPAGVHIEL